VFSRLPKLAIVAALACSLGLHWGLLQSVAWVRMVLSYSQVSPLTEAVSKTFDGKHPCSICKGIAQSRQSEKKPESFPTAKKFEFSYSATAFLFAAPSEYWEAGRPEAAGATLARTPPVPPPRQLPG
jgi:hypothetical protein